MIVTSAGVWGVRPGRNDVVLLAPGYVATDGEAEDSLRVMLKAVQILQMKVPVVAVAERARDLVQRLLDALGHGWRVVPTKLVDQNKSRLKL